ncbi:MAG TPA: aromatic ring-hydroxylating dioxygenase subunit alpha [Ilumatobacteraceae bacterium]|nr:aromatic ring-hydroxylating dioxygenase subunit alpha [Ilumatobacteraceae bacterium]
MSQTLDADTRGAAYQALLDIDSRPVPDVLRWQSQMEDDSLTVPVKRYTDPDYHRLEVEHLWKKVWQMACREEDIPVVGDHINYEIAGMDILVVRSAPDQIKAFRNVCLHRGRVLKEFDGRDEELRCAFHGIAWNLDGTLKHVPCRWDFPQVGQDWSLLDVQVGTWGGFVFINLDPQAAPLEDHLGSIPEHFTKWPLEERFKQVHVGKILECNWKLAQEAFMESFHVVATHPQLLAGMGDSITQYDVFGNFGRQLTPNGVTSTHVRNWVPTAQDMVDAVTDRTLDIDPIIVVPDGKSAREALGDVRRAALADVIGPEKAEALSDAEVCDSIVYTLFPNFHPWGSYNRIVYRFRPYGTRHDMSIMECMILSPFKGERPPAATLRMLGVDDDWTEAHELGLLTRVFNQDVYNLPRVQAGLASGALDQVTFARYQESKIRMVHTELARLIGR